MIISKNSSLKHNDTIQYMNDEQTVIDIVHNFTAIDGKGMLICHAKGLQTSKLAVLAIIRQLLSHNTKVDTESNIISKILILCPGKKKKQWLDDLRVRNVYNHFEFGNISIQSMGEWFDKVDATLYDNDDMSKTANSHLKTLLTNALLIVDDAHHCTEFPTFDTDTGACLTGQMTAGLEIAAYFASKILLVTHSPIVDGEFDILPLRNILLLARLTHPRRRMDLFAEAYRKRPVNAIEKLFKDIKGKVSYRDVKEGIKPDTQEVIAKIEMDIQSAKQYYKKDALLRVHYNITNADIYEEAFESTDYMLDARIEANKLPLKHRWMEKHFKEWGISGDKIVVYSICFEEGILVAQQICNKLGLTNAILELHNEPNSKIIKRYMDGDIQVLLVIGQDEMTNLNLWKTNRLVIMEPHWNIAQLKEMIGCSMRTGSRMSSRPINARPVTIYHLILTRPSRSAQYIEPTCDEIAFELSRRKQTKLDMLYDRLEESSIEYKEHPNNNSKIESHDANHHHIAKYDFTNIHENLKINNNTDENKIAENKYRVINKQHIHDVRPNVTDHIRIRINVLAALQSYWKEKWKRLGWNSGHINKELSNKYPHSQWACSNVAIHKKNILAKKWTRHELKEHRKAIRAVVLDYLKLVDGPMFSTPDPSFSTALLYLTDLEYFGGFFTWCNPNAIVIDSNGSDQAHAGVASRIHRKLHHAVEIIRFRYSPSLIDELFAINSSTIIPFICGIVPRDKLEAVTTIFEHEFCHLVIDLTGAYKNGVDPHCEEFQKYSKELFGHTRFAGSYTLSVFHDVVRNTDGSDTLIVEPNEKVIQFYTTLSPGDKVYVFGDETFVKGIIKSMSKDRKYATVILNNIHDENGHPVTKMVSIFGNIFPPYKLRKNIVS